MKQRLSPYHLYTIHVISIGYYHLRRLRQLRRHITQNAMKQLVCSLILSRIDYCNSILSGLPVSSIAPCTSASSECGLMSEDSPVGSGTLETALENQTISSVAAANQKMFSGAFPRVSDAIFGDCLLSEADPIGSDRLAH